HLTTQFEPCATFAAHQFSSTFGKLCVHGLQPCELCVGKLLVRLGDQCQPTRKFLLQVLTPTLALRSCVVRRTLRNQLPRRSRKQGNTCHCNEQGITYHPHEHLPQSPSSPVKLPCPGSGSAAGTGSSVSRSSSSAMRASSVRSLTPPAKASPEASVSETDEIG